MSSPPTTRPSAPVAPKIGTTSAQATPSAKPTIHQAPVTIEIVSPPLGTTYYVDPGQYHRPKTGGLKSVLPSMPLLPLEAHVKVNGEKTTLGTVRWEFSIKGQYRVRHGNDYAMQDFQFALGSPHTLPWEKGEFRPSLLVGGDLTINAAYYGPDGTKWGHAATVVGCCVHGKNPPQDDLEQFIVDHAPGYEWLFLRLFGHESGLRQFGADGGVLYGPPSGVGVAQRDPDTSEWQWQSVPWTKPYLFFPTIFWSWRENVLEGIRYFQGAKLGAAHDDIAALRQLAPNLPALPHDLVLQAAIRRYNGYTEFQVASDDSCYVVETTSPNNPGYVKDVFDNTIASAARRTKYPVPADVLPNQGDTWPTSVATPKHWKME